MKLKPTPHKRGSRVLGHIHLNADGTRHYLARRKIADIYRRSEKNLSSAIRLDIAGWGVDEDTLFKMRALGVEQIGVTVLETGETYLAPLDVWFQPENFWTQGRARGNERCLPMSKFIRTHSMIRM